MGAARFYLFGKGIAHSLSPALFGAAARELGLSWDYRLCDCATEGDFARELHGRSFAAANVTTPYKECALREVDAADAAGGAAGADGSSGAGAEACATARALAAAAREANAANLLIRGRTRLHAFNTDGAGFALFLKCGGVRLDGLRVAVCGTGPAGRSIARALAREGARAVLLSRSGRYDALRYGTPEACDALRGADVVVDATPLAMMGGGSAIGGRAGDGSADGAAADGMFARAAAAPRTAKPPFDPALLSAHQLAVDTVYAHGETPLQRAARAAGARHADGRGMLAGQAAVAMPLILASLGVPASPKPATAEDFFAIMGKTLSAHSAY